MKRGKKKITKKVLEKREKRLLNRINKLKKKELVNEMFKRDGGVCVFCHKPVNIKHYQTCHIIPEDFPETRYDINNVLLGCFYHHKVGQYSMHQHPLWFVAWLQTHRLEQYRDLMEKMKFPNFENLKGGINENGMGKKESSECNNT